MSGVENKNKKEREKELGRRENIVNEENKIK